MALKRILIPVERHPFVNHVFTAAGQLAGIFSSEVVGVPTWPIVNEFAVAGAFGGGVPIGISRESESVSIDELKALFEQGRPSAGVTSAAPDRWLWRGDERFGEPELGLLARVFDITVVGRPRSDGSSPHNRTFETILFDSGRPMLIVPPSGPKATLGRNIYVAWNGSSETARCVALAMPLIERAERVTVLTVEGGSVTGPKGTELADLLAANAAKVEARTVNGGTRSVGETILAEAASNGADLIIKGAYTQSRLRQMFFGGATSHILAATETPVFMSH